jgi:hypothetical protein
VILGRSFDIAPAKGSIALLASFIELSHHENFDHRRFGFFRGPLDGTLSA